jgi:hypothetical protein
VLSTVLTSALAFLLVYLSCNPVTFGILFLEASDLRKEIRAAVASSWKLVEGEDRCVTPSKFKPSCQSTTQRG